MNSWIEWKHAFLRVYARQNHRQRGAIGNGLLLQNN